MILTGSHLNRFEIEIGDCLTVPNRNYWQCLKETFKKPLSESCQNGKEREWSNFMSIVDNVHTDKENITLALVYNIQL